MKTNAHKMATLAKILGSTTVLGSLLLVGGCGSDSSTPAASTVSSSTTIATTSVAAGATAGTIKTSTDVSAKTSSGATAITIPAGVTITPPAGKTFDANNPPTIEVKTFNDVSALPAPLTAGFTVNSVAGAVDVTVGGLNGITFSGGKATISIPIAAGTTTCEVFVNKNDGKGYKDLGSASSCANGVATIAVADLCTYAVNPVFKGATGSTGGTGSNGF